MDNVKLYRVHVRRRPWNSVISYVWMLYLLPEYCALFSGWLSGIAGLATGHPLDTVKVRMQTSEDKTMRGTIQSTFRDEGFRGFYKGLVLPVIASGVRNAIFFGVYGNVLRFITGAGDKTLCCEESPLPHAHSSGTWHSKSAISGFLGGLVSSIVSCPVECVKTKMQGNRKSSMGSWTVAKEIVKRRGIVGLYCGFTSCMMRDAPGAPSFGNLVYMKTTSPTFLFRKFMIFISKCEFISGWLSGIAGIVTGHPLDTVKVRMQTSDGKSLKAVLRSTFHNEGIRGFYKGMAFPVLSAGVLNAIFFGVYGNCLRLVASSGDKTLCCEEMVPRHPDEAWHYKVAFAGFVGGLASTVVGCPVESVKVKLQGNRNQKLDTWVVVKKIIKRSGIRGLYCGFIPMIYRDGPGFAIYILAYEHVLCAMEGTIPVGSHHKFSSEVFSGGLAGAISWSLAMPFDVVKSRLQMDDPDQPKYKGMGDCFRKSFHKDGLSIFFKGFEVAVIRSFPVNAVTFVVYQYSMRLCKLWTSP